jgi:hypothetical protein
MSFFRSIVLLVDYSRSKEKKNKFSRPDGRRQVRKRGYEKGGTDLNWAGLFGAVYVEIAIQRASEA